MAGSTLASPTAEAAPAPAPAASGRDTWRRFRRHRLAVVSVGVLGLLVLAVLVGGWVWPVAIDDIDFAATLQGPSWAHPLGTDDLGRDVLSRIILGVRASLQVAVLAVATALAVGVPLGLVAGRERIYFEHFWNDFAADGRKSVSEADRRFYAKQYAQPGAMKSGMEVFRAFDQDAKDNTEFAKTKLTMPMLVLGGEKSGGDFLIEQGRMVATDVEGMLVKGSGHWLIDEAPGIVIPKLVEFLGVR